MKLFKKKVLFTAMVLCTLNSFAYTGGDVVVLIVADGCGACVEAENILRTHNIKFTTLKSDKGIVPQLTVNGQLVGYGTKVVWGYVSK